MPWRRLARTLLAGPAADAPANGGRRHGGLARRQADAAAQPRLGRSLAILHVDAGSCGGCEIELRAVTRAVYDLERFGMRFVARRAMPTCCW